MPEIVAKRTVAADDGAHDHLDLLGYSSPHIQYEPIMVSIPRLLQKMPLDEPYWMTVDGERVAVKEGKCRICGHAPYLVTEKDSPDRALLLELPEL